MAVSPMGVLSAASSCCPLVLWSRSAPAGAGASGGGVGGVLVLF